MAAAPAAVKKAAAPAKPVNPLYEKRPKSFGALQPSSGSSSSSAFFQSQCGKDNKNYSSDAARFEGRRLLRCRCRRRRRLTAAVRLRWCCPLQASAATCR